MQGSVYTCTKSQIAGKYQIISIGKQQVKFSSHATRQGNFKPNEQVKLSGGSQDACAVVKSLPKSKRIKMKILLLISIS